MIKQLQIANFLKFLKVRKKLNGIKSPTNGSKPELGVPFNIKKS